MATDNQNSSIARREWIAFGIIVISIATFFLAAYINKKQICSLAQRISLEKTK